MPTTACEKVDYSLLEILADTTDREANELAEIYWLAYQLPESEGRQVQELAHSYARVVVEDPTGSCDEVDLPSIM